MKNILYIRSDKHLEFELGLYTKKNITTKKIKCPIGTMSEKILSTIDNLISSAHLSLMRIDAIVVYLGPGSYTSLRIGISTANAIAYSLDIPIYGISKKSDFDIDFVDQLGSKKAFDMPVRPYYDPTPNLPS